jgi:hypothetical protein
LTHVGFNHISKVIGHRHPGVILSNSPQGRSTRTQGFGHQPRDRRWGAISDHNCQRSVPAQCNRRIPDLSSKNVSSGRCRSCFTSYKERGV